MNKICSHCGNEKPLGCFSKHPTASLGRKHLCKTCDSKYARTRYAKKLEEQGKKPYTFLGGFVSISNHKRGDIRKDGAVFWSKRPVGDGYREWWMTKEEFYKRAESIKSRQRWRYKNDPVYREKSREKNQSDESRARKRRWNKNNRHRIDCWQAERRAKVRGSAVNLSAEERARISEWYKFRDILNAVHGKPMFHVDHKKAISRGGKHHPDNLQVTTAEYNVRKFVNEYPNHKTMKRAAGY